MREFYDVDEALRRLNERAARYAMLGATRTEIGHRYWCALYRWDEEFTALTLSGVRRFESIVRAVRERRVTDDELPAFLR